MKYGKTSAFRLICKFEDFQRFLEFSEIRNEKSTYASKSVQYIEDPLANTSIYHH